MPERNSYAYKLEGFDSDWNYCGSKRTATFTGLDPGTYTFRVKGANEDGIWNETGTSIRVIIAPPWWRSGWAYGSYVLFLTAVVFLLNRLQRARLVRRERERAGIEEVRLLAEAAEAQARALEAEHKRKTHELEEARKLQLSMLPEKVPEIPGMDIAVYMKTATEVGGDYYDFYTAEDGTLTVAAGDATGHGLKAGTMVSIMKSLFLAEVSSPSLRAFFDKSNRTIKDMRLGNLFMALTVVRLKEGKGMVAAAGMPPVYIYRKDNGVVEEIVLKAPPIGAFGKLRYRYGKLVLGEGDTLLLFSDGLPESFNPGGEMFGYDRLKALFAEKGGEAPAAIIDHLVKAGEAWLSGSPQGDDITFVVLSRRRG